MNVSIKPIALLFLFLLPSCSYNRGPDRNQSVFQSYDPSKIPDVGMSEERLNRIDPVVEKYIENQWISGATGIIARHGRIVYHKSFGMRDVEMNDAMENSDLYRIASMTKAVTTVAALMLYEEGHFLLDDPLYHFIPEFKDPVILETMNPADSTYTTRPASKQITIRQLFNHTSGIGYSFSHPRLSPIYGKAGIPDGFVTTDAILADKIKLLGTMPLLHEPGEEYTYGLNTDVLGYLVEVISGMSLKDFFIERIFEPLEMNDTYFFLDDALKDRLVTIYANTESGLKKSDVREYDYPLTGGKSYYSGGAGLISTALDYCKFLQMLVNNGSYNGHQLLSPKTIELMTKNQVGNLRGGGWFGLGFGITTEAGSADILSSTGNYWWGGYFSTSFWVDPAEDIVAVFMTQMFPAQHGEIHQKFQVLAYQAIVD